MFTCNEIIFSATTQCNLHCSHCFVSRSNNRLNIDDCKKLIDSCLAYNKPDCELEKIGFTGGEPFLYLDFICEISNYALEKDLMFDRLMTNGDFWKTETELKESLQKVFNSGFDGKIGLSYDNFHNQTRQRILTFIKAVYDIWQDYTSVEIISVFSREQTITEKLFLTELDAIRRELENEYKEIYLPVFKIRQSFPAEHWHDDKKWFKDDYCTSTGNIFYVHSDGNIAPCCGFANENPALFIGTIKDDCKTIMENAQKNTMVQNCFTRGLGKLRLEMEKDGVEFPGKNDDMCMFCDYLCKKDITTQTHFLTKSRP